ncbi:hypothetical protein MOSE0_L06700 [Monosporozyma servazzii]
MFNTLEPLLIAENYQPSSSMMGSPMTPFNSNKYDYNNNNSNNNNNEQGSRLRSYCFPDNASTSSGPSVNSYLKKIYGDSASSVSYTQSRMNSNYNNSIRNKSNNFRSISNGEIMETDDDDDDMTSTTMDPEERKNLVNHLNEYSFETLRENINDSNKQRGNVSSRYNNEDDFIEDICPRTPSPDKLNNQQNISSSINDIQIAENNNNNNVPLTKNQNVLMRKCSIIPPPQHYPTNLYSNRQLQHRQSNAFSLSQEFDGLKIDETILSPKENPENKKINLITPFERFKDIYMDDDDSPISPLSYPHQTSPIKTINNTNEQIKRNLNGRFDSLKDFANFNNIMIEGKRFVERPHTPTINLEEK